MANIIIIGGGPAGMLAALYARQHGAQAILVERNEKLGKKLYITGKGRCNVTNDADADAFFANVVQNPRFLFSAFHHFSNQDLMALLFSLGVPLKTERGGRVFPQSDRSSDITRAFERELHRWGIEVRLNTKVESLLFDDRRVSGVEYVGGAIEKADAVILATGGVSYPSTGSTGDGYNFAKVGGHTITTVRSALVPLETAESWPKDLMGLSLKNVTLNYKKGKKTVFSEMGELLFTHFGISGPLALSLSSHLPDVLSNEKVFIDLKPALSEQVLDARLLRDFKQYGRKQLISVLDGLAPHRLALQLSKCARLTPEIPVHSITQSERKQLLAVLKNLPLHIAGYRPLTEAIITRGGVSIHEVNPSTMESKKVKGLFFAGEILDVDGLTGGFNLQIAFSTGALAGKSAALNAVQG